MELSFTTEELRGICESRRKARKRLGVAASQALEMILADIDACQSVSELESIYGDLPAAAGGDGWELTLDACIRLRFVSGHVKTLTRKGGHVDKSNVTRIRIESIEAVR